MRISKHGTHISLNSDISDALVEVIPGIEDANLDEAVNAIVDKVRGSIGGVEGKEPTVANIAPIVQAIIGDKNMQLNMSTLAQDLLSGKLDIPSLVGQVKQSVMNNQETIKSDSAPQLISSEGSNE